MIWRRRGVQIPVEIYHSVPNGWRADDIFSVHRSMRGTFPISDFDVGKWRAPSWMPNRYEWLRYKATLERVAGGVRAGDAACVELAVRYIELRYIGSYSGFLRARLAKALKSADLNPRQRFRLDDHFLSLVLNQDYTEEFREYRKLWARIITDEPLDRVTVLFRRLSAGEMEPTWLIELRAAQERTRPPDERARR